MFPSCFQTLDCLSANLCWWVCVLVCVCSSLRSDTPDHVSSVCRMHIHQVHPWLLLVALGSGVLWELRWITWACFWTLTVLLAVLLLCQFLLRCDFQCRRALAGFQPLWFVADDGTILARQFAGSNHSNKRGGELSGSWAPSQVMSSSASTNSPPLSSLKPKSRHNALLLKDFTKTKSTQSLLFEKSIAKKNQIN